MFSSENEKNVSHFSGFLETIVKGGKIYGATDQLYNPIHVEDVAKIIFQISLPLKREL